VTENYQSQTIIKTIKYKTIKQQVSMHVTVKIRALLDGNLLGRDAGKQRRRDRKHNWTCHTAI